jgi:hypothetical protein
MQHLCIFFVASARMYQWQAPMNHFENFDTGIDAAIATTAHYIATSCDMSSVPEWGDFQGAIKLIADSFQVGWVGA